ncbi:hypothetical protein HG536_0A01850 [Torulaspora globosa]|uniref:Uncharacterized protein n=1 Tax=Torulaspora globosa TaxID=48254 RepID=A0A7G3ZA32_9SACH|nr:uncharacterized protein HG536_0A01850 [Torulaspora globosa]QLL30368.1 hypothetical protein HG536_0A01850 [Torulaspora globosa]
MKYVTLQGSWRALFFGTFRRQPSSKNYRYKYVASKIKKLVLDTHTKGLTNAKSELMVIRCDRQLFTSSIHKLREVILKDISGPPEACIKILQTGRTLRRDWGPTGVLSWQNIAPIFAHPLNPICATEGGDPSFEYRNTLRLSSKDDREELLHVRWADLTYSNSCRGVGVTKEKFSGLGKDVEFVNPANGNLLRVYQVDEVPEGCDAIALFPAYVPSQRRYFTGLELCAALIRQSPCTREEQSKLEAHISSSLKNQNDTAVTPVAEHPLDETCFVTLKQLMDATNKCKPLWSSGRDKDKTCPGDVIRCSLVSEKVDFSQLVEEYCKHYILFSLVSQALRMSRTVDQSASYESHKLEFSPMDTFVWQELQRINEIAPPTTVSELIGYKKQIDEFLELLSSYYFSIVSEMKASSRTYFRDGINVPRAVPVLRVLLEVVCNCKGFKIFYPNLSLYATKVLPEMPKLGEAKETVVANEEANLTLGSKVLAMFKHIAQFENMMFYDKFSIATGLEIEPITSLKSWKIVIVSKSPLPVEIERALLFSSRVYTQCVRDLEHATLLQHATCEARRMIDEDTFMFLYRLQRPPKVDREQLANAIIEKLDEASKTYHT